MAKRESKTKKTATRKATASRKRTAAPADGRGLLLGEYKDVADLIKRGTSDDRITAAIFCNYPVGNLNVEHLTNDDLKNIVATFTPAEWITYGYHGAIHETAYQFVQDFAKAAREYLNYGRILHGYAMLHKSARQTADLLTDILGDDGNQRERIQAGGTTLYGWNVSPDDVVTPDFSKDLGNGTTFAKIAVDASSDVFKAMEKAKALYIAFEHFRDRVDDEIKLTRKDDILFSDLVKHNLQIVMKDYAPFPEYGLGYLEQYAEEKGVDMKDLPAEMLEIGYFPSWGLATPEPLQISGNENYLHRIFSENVRDYGRIVSNATGMDKFVMGKYVFMTTGERSLFDDDGEPLNNE